MLSSLRKWSFPPIVLPFVWSIWILFPTHLQAQEHVRLNAADSYALISGNSLSIDEIVSLQGPDTTALKGLQISISQNYESGIDLLSYTEADGIVGVFDSNNGILTLSGNGNLDTYQLALSRVIFTTSATQNSNGTKTITVSLSNLDYYPETGHFYEFFPAPNITWKDAAALAADQSLFGLRGYLATITTSGENQFVVDRVSGTSWIGANDEVSEGDWRWVTGPEGLENGGLGRKLTDGFTNWDASEPNNLGEEDYAHMKDWSTPPGKWNDLRNQGAGGEFAPRGFIIEFGGLEDPSEASISGTTEIDILPPLELLGLQIICSESGPSNYSATTFSGYNYFWTVTGGQISGGQGTPDIQVEWGPSNADAEVSLRVTSPLSKEFEISLPVEIVGEIVPVFVIENVKCHGQSDGSVIIPEVSGLGPFSYRWNVNNNAVVTDNAVSGLSAGSYSVDITSRDCTVNLPFVITQPQVLTGSVSVKNILCSGEPSGSAEVIVSGGNGAYRYVWSHDPTLNQASLGDLFSGDYAVEVYDENKCVLTLDFSITEPQPLTGSISTQDILCSGEANGTAQAVVSGGTAPYRYVWSHDASINQAQVDDLSKGDYSLEVYDANNCVLTLDFSIAKSRTLDGSVSVQNILCSGETTGAAEITVSGGIAPYRYVWSHDPDLNQASLNNMPSGVYSVEVFDANNCLLTLEFIIAEPRPLTGWVSVQNVLCSREATGAAEIIVSGGVAPYRYVWSHDPNLNQASLSNIQSGDYTVEVYDANGCMLNLDLSITEPEALVITEIIPTKVSCPGGNDGSLEAIVIGGTRPYTYTWSDSFETNSFVSGLTQGAYQLTVTDANGCSTTASQIVEEAIPKIKFPTAFSPNGDNMNDTFGPTTACDVVFRMNIYNTWGELIFSSQNAQERWDGRLKGVPVPSGKYTYIAAWSIEANGFDTMEERRGTVLLIR